MDQLLHEAWQLLPSLSAGKDSSTPQEEAERYFRLVHDRSSAREGESLIFLAPSPSEYVEQVESIASMYEREYWHKQRLLEGISYHHPNKTEEKDEQQEEERERMTLQNIHALWLSEPHIRHSLGSFLLFLLVECHLLFSLIASCSPLSLLSVQEACRLFCSILLLSRISLLISLLQQTKVNKWIGAIRASRTISDSLRH
ncbi:hypothetical protein QOT17_013186 [Balamuthia mandrillaris]